MGKNRDFSKFPNAITVLDNGNVGIGTTTFSEGTQPTGTLSFIPNSSVSSGPLIQLAGNGRIRPASDGDRLSIDGNALFLNSTIGGNILTNGAGGNLAINTTPPSTTSFSHLFVGRNFSLFSGSSSDIYIGSNFYYDTTFKARYSQGSTMINTNNGDIIFQNSSSGTAGAALAVTERMRITNTGNVGIASTADWSYPGLNALQVSTTSLYGYSGYAAIAFNLRFNSGWKYVTSGGGSYLELGPSGDIVYYTAAAGGSAGANAGTVSERFRIGVGGQVTVQDKIVVVAQPSFIAYASSNQEPSSDTILSYNVTTANRGNCYNTSNSRFTAPVGGIYAFGVKMWYRPNATGTIWLYLRKNGGYHTEQRMSVGTATANFTSWFPKWIINLAAGDYIEVSGYGDGGNFHTSNSEYYSQFYGHLLH